MEKFKPLVDRVVGLIGEENREFVNSLATVCDFLEIYGSPNPDSDISLPTTQNPLLLFWDFEKQKPSKVPAVHNELVSALTASLFFDSGCHMMSLEKLAETFKRNKSQIMPDVIPLDLIVRQMFCLIEESTETV